MPLPFPPAHSAMPRIPYQPDDLREPAAVVAAIRRRRGGRLFHLDRLLLHSPPFAAAWNDFMRQVRTGLSLPPQLREIAICAVAVLNRAEYEFHHHAPLLLDAGGTAEQVEALRRLEQGGGLAPVFDAAERAVIRLTTDMTRAVQVGDDTFAAVRAVLPGEQQVVELVGLIAAYNMVSRFLVALGVEPE
jgi:alkylhydroperoxidase family enzyme